MSGEENLLVTCLCVTENRLAFMPWLLWCYDRQTWPYRELVIVDSSAQPIQIERDDIRVVPAASGSSVGLKRNLAMKSAQGEIIAWFDDDDWQHPQRLERLVAALQEGAPYAGSRLGWFVSLEDLSCSPYRAASGHVIFNNGGFQREAASACAFPENLRKASDTRWMQALRSRYPGQAALLPDDGLFFWLCHTANLSNPARRRRFTRPVEALRRQVGEAAWGDTSQALAELQERLQPVARPAAHAVKKRPARRAQAVQPLPGGAPGPQDAAGDPPVSVMIKATVLDAPYLEVMARHMIAQARYPFAERAIVVERQVSFSGKYRSRPQATDAELDVVLEQLLAEGVVDRVVEVDARPALRQEILQRYFVKDAARVPTHAVTGGPIYATLFGMESLPTDLVLQLDADMFFYTGAASWVRQALELLAREPHAWLLMTHPGPPAGPAGGSLGKANDGRAAWDAALQVWRFKHATTRYFLCDRSRLYGRLQPVWRGSGCAPLEQCLSLALQRHGAFRLALGDLNSWHLHAWSHAAPFPKWASLLAQTVAAGRFPQVQAGEYDLRLDHPAQHRAWQIFLGQTVTQPTARLKPEPPRPPAVEQEPKPYHPPPHPAIKAGSQPADPLAPLSVIIPIRDRAGERVRNLLAGLRWQSAGFPAQVLLVSQGSHPQIDHQLGELCAEYGAELLRTGDPGLPWNKSLALNTGIRATRPEIPYLMTMDSDMILAPNFLEVVLQRLAQPPKALVLCRISDIPRQAHLPSTPEDLLADFDRLRGMTHLRNRYGSGGIQAASRSFFFEIRGYDEDLLWWGAMDNDILNRAQRLGLELAWIEEQTAMLHQWHPRKSSILSNQREIAQAQKYWWRNHELVRQRAGQVYRNPQGWGGLVE